MVSNNQRKQILQLKQKKYRLSSGYFVAEGEKVVEEILSASWECVFLFSTVPNFFPKTVMVNTDDTKIKNNRYSLLYKLRQNLNCVADISKLAS